MHRDVSIGNILSCDGHAKLADLEYAKKMGDLNSHDMRTASESPISLSGKLLITPQQGTRDFMSVEVAAHTFIFTPSNTVIPTIDEISMESPQDEEMFLTEVTEVPFSHNHVHDLESVWWVAVWMVFYNYFTEMEATSRDRPSFTLQDAILRLDIARELFPPILNSTTRFFGFQSSEAFQENFHRLPKGNRATYRYLDILRQHLIKNYKDIEATHPQSVDPSCANDDIYEEFKKVFSALASNKFDFALDFVPKIYETLKKRPRSESTNDTGVSQKAARY